MSPSSGGSAEGLNAISFYLGQAYYNHIRLLERTLADVGLEKRVKPGMGHILAALFEEDDRIIKGISERTNLAASTLTGMLSRIERAGLVKRCRDDSDGRAVRVRLTPLGKSIRPACREVTRRLSAVLQAGMKKEEVGVLKALLRRVIANIRADAEKCRGQ